MTSSPSRGLDRVDSTTKFDVTQKDLENIFSKKSRDVVIRSRLLRMTSLQFYLMTDGPLIEGQFISRD